MKILTIYPKRKRFRITNDVFSFQLRKKLLEKAREGTLKPVQQSNGESAKAPPSKRKGRWDMSSGDTPVAKKLVVATPNSQSTPSWDAEVCIA